MVTMTVGELIEVLSKFDPSLPALKADPESTCYHPVELSTIMVFLVKRSRYSVNDEYIDCRDNDDEGFSAIVL